MDFTQYIKYTNGEISEYELFYKNKEELIQILKEDFNFGGIEATLAINKNGNLLAYFDKNTELNNGGEKLKKATKEEVLQEINSKVFVLQPDIREVLDSLEKQGYIKFKKEPKKYKVFVKLVTIGEKDKKLYYVNDYHLTENIDEAERFETYEDKDGYAYEYVKEY